MSESKPESTSPKRRVLIVDDDPDNRHFISRVLEQFWIIEEVNSAIKGLAAIEKNRPDIVISDIMMPLMDGFEFLEKLKSTPGNESLPVILLSGRDEDETQIRAKKAGASGYFIKPVDCNALAARIRSLLPRE